MQIPKMLHVQNYFLLIYADGETFGKTNIPTTLLRLGAIFETGTSP